MSVSVPVILSIDGDARRIYLKSGVSDFFPIEDIYHEYRYLRRTDESLRKWEPLIRAEGNVSKGGGAATPRYLVLLLGTKIVPFDESLQLNQLGDMITDDPDTDASLYDISGLTTAKPIFIKPSESEIIQLNSKQIEFSSYSGGITLDVDNLTGNAESSLTVAPDEILGSLQTPCDNLVDAAVQLDNVGLGQVYIIGNATISDETNWLRTAFIGDSANKSLITVNPIANVVNCEFYNCSLTGTLDGNSYIANSIISDLNFVDGYIEECFLGPATITLGTSTQANFVRCTSNLSGPTNTPVIDHNSTGVLAMRDYTGGCTSRNYSGTGDHSIDLARGQWILENTVTGGNWVFRGIGKLVDQNGDSILSDLDSKGRPIPTAWNGAMITNELLNQENIARGLLFYDSVNIP